MKFHRYALGVGLIAMTMSVGAQTGGTKTYIVELADARERVDVAPQVVVGVVEEGGEGFLQGCPQRLHSVRRHIVAHAGQDFERWIVDEVPAATRAACTACSEASLLFIAGLSMGGFGTWETAMEYPETYAALMPICGGAGVKFILAERIKHIPEWIFHGAKDPVVDPAFSKKMNDVLLKLGAQVKFTIYPDAQPDSWTATYDNPEVWKWLFEQHRAKH